MQPEVLEKTLYVHYGDIFVFACCVLITAVRPLDQLLLV